MFINRLNLAVSALCSRDETRPALTGVHITATHTEATNGHCAGRITMPDFVKAEDFPPCAGVVDTTDALAPCVIPREAAEAIAKAIPRKSYIPFLLNARVDVAASNANGRFRAVTTDLDTVTPIETHRLDVNFPDLEQAFPPTEPTLTIAFDAELLARVLKVAGAFSPRSHYVEFRFFGKDGLGLDRPVKITAKCLETGQIGEFIVAPMRLP